MIWFMYSILSVQLGLPGSLSSEYIKTHTNVILCDYLCYDGATFKVCYIQEVLVTQ